jgi:hypothetical protein
VLIVEDPLPIRVIDFFKERWRLVASSCAVVLVAGAVIWIAIAKPFSNPYTVVNAGDGKVYKVNVRTGESWLLNGTREYPTSPPSPVSADDFLREADYIDFAITKAKASSVLTEALVIPGHNANTNTIQKMFEQDHQCEIIGWSGQKVDEHTYLVSFTYKTGTGDELGFYFEVNDDVDTVRNIFHGTGLYKKYEKYGIKPGYMLGHDGKSAVPKFNTGGKIIWDDWKDDPVAGSKQPGTSE